jgi:hypothetical protein
MTNPGEIGDEDLPLAAELCAANNATAHGRVTV